MSSPFLHQHHLLLFASTLWVYSCFAISSPDRPWICFVDVYVWFEEGDWTHQTGGCCLSHWMSEVWHDTLVVAVESREDGLCELSWVHLAKLLSKVVSPSSWPVNALAFHRKSWIGSEVFGGQGSFPWLAGGTWKCVLDKGPDPFWLYSAASPSRILMFKFNFGRL